MFPVVPATASQAPASGRGSERGGVGRGSMKFISKEAAGARLDSSESLDGLSGAGSADRRQGDESLSA